MSEKIDGTTAGRFCKACGRPIPSENESDLCDRCLEDKRERRGLILTGGLGVGAALVGFRKQIGAAAKKMAPVVKEYGPKVIQVIKNIKP
jgi:predicted nucleic acid-binding Zn ribbon protein